MLELLEFRLPYDRTYPLIHLDEKIKAFNKFLQVQMKLKRLHKFRQNIYAVQVLV
ncbi:hypothetical protein M595_2500 [Lyngbya aestuarii BL J]|uniref:Uncharacterized protein n=1 Tax=Lyngbya aestuarii BL J TaxID=1348334 RepID=U7QJV7_9CYAN|nr:hypothetical protein M595_2500 [Lyngbya aestuarii BL J]